MIDFTTQQEMALILLLIIAIGIAIAIWKNDFKDE
jgi:hypothetical protein|tara:strand:+ start:88 stop:192 length:105 start_codon:yes stop_codon:yes gene_type:complete